jgi:hypothetical protein
MSRKEKRADDEFRAVLKGLSPSDAHQLLLIENGFRTGTSPMRKRTFLELLSGQKLNSQREALREFSESRHSAPELKAPASPFDFLPQAASGDQVIEAAQAAVEQQAKELKEKAEREEASQLARKRAAEREKAAPAKEERKRSLSGVQRGACRAALIEIGNFLTEDVAKLNRDLAAAAKSEKLNKLIPQLDRFRVNATNARIGAKGFQQRHAFAVQLMGGRPDLGRLANALGELSTKISQVKEGVSSGWPHEAVMECVVPLKAKNLEVGKIVRRLKRQTEENEAEYLR